MRRLIKTVLLTMVVLSLFLPATAVLPPEYSAWEQLKVRCQENPNATYSLEEPLPNTTYPAGLLRGNIQLNGTETNVVNCQQIDQYSLSVDTSTTKTVEFPMPVFLLAVGLFTVIMWGTYRKGQLRGSLVSIGNTLATIAVAVGLSNAFSLPAIVRVFLVLAVFFIPGGYILMRRDEVWSKETLLLLLVPLIVIFLVLATYMTFIGYTYTPLSSYFATA